MSVYPYWDKEAGLTKDYKETISKVMDNITALNRKYGCELMIVETGVEAKKPDDGKTIMQELIKASRTQCDGHCKGVFYWAPELEGQYPLGAFQDHKPTAIMDAFRE